MSKSDDRTELLRLQTRVAELEEAAACRARAETVLRESEQLYRSLIETSPDSIVVADLDGCILMANQQTVSLYGFEHIRQAIGTNILDRVAPEQAEQAARDIRKILQSGGLRDRQYLLRRQDGTMFSAEVSGSLIRDSAGAPKYILYNGRDITSRIRLQRELAETQKLDSIGRLAGGIAHDFNNLLAVVLGNASLQLRNRALPKKTLDCLQDIVEAAERASGLTTQLLAYARGGLRRAAPTDLNRVVANAWELVGRTTPRQIEIQMRLADDLPSIVLDQAQIQQVVMNLYLNAIQASPTPGIIEVETADAQLDEAQAEDVELSPGRYLKIRVVDHGCGMDEATQEQIFEPFFTTKADGRGMGLPASQGIVQSHSGRLVVRSTPGKGTEATVWLPLDTPASREHASAVPALTNPPQGNETILVVDAEANVGRVAEQILSSLGYCVVARPDAEQALAFLASNSEDVDMVLLNPDTPRWTSRQMLEKVREGRTHLPVLLMSGHQHNPTAEELLSGGAAGFVSKPFSFMSLAQAVRKLLDERAARPATDRSDEEVK